MISFLPTSLHPIEKNIVVPESDHPDLDDRTSVRYRGSVDYLKIHRIIVRYQDLLNLFPLFKLTTGIRANMNLDCKQDYCRTSEDNFL